MKNFGDFVTRHYPKLQEKLATCKDDWNSIEGFPVHGSLEEQRDFTLHFLHAALPEDNSSDRMLERVILWYVRSGLVARDDDLKPEDFSKITEALEIFQQKKNKFPKEKRNINQFATWLSFKEFLEPYREKIFLTTHEREDRDNKFLNGIDAVCAWQSASLRIIHLKTEKASQAYGKGTTWCTAFTDKPNFFKDYADALGACKNRCVVLSFILLNTKDRAQSVHGIDRNRIPVQDSCLNKVVRCILGKYTPKTVPGKHNLLPIRNIF
jgi:hypothetical protein